MNFAQQIKNIDADPNQKISYCSQYKELLKQEIVESEYECLCHSKHVNIFILFGDRVIILAGECLISFNKYGEHGQTDGSLTESQEAGEEILVTMKYC